MSQPRKRRRLRPNKPASPVTITIDLRQLLHLVIGTFIGWILGLNTPSGVRSQMTPIQIVPGSAPMTIEADGKKPPSHKEPPPPSLGIRQRGSKDPLPASGLILTVPG